MRQYTQKAFKEDIFFSLKNAQNIVLNTQNLSLIMLKMYLELHQIFF